MRLFPALLLVTLSSAFANAANPSAWTIYIANDNCPDYTWGFTEAQTRKAFADIVRAHLDEMTRTDSQPFVSRNRYNMAVTQEALCFVERYPQRKDELIRRIKEGRVYVSPFLCNSLWGFQSAESAIRTLYPARRLEREWGIPKIDVAEHIELPSLPWGMAPILGGCGIRWLSNPYYAYDSTFGGLTCPPLFLLEGPDGSRLRVVMDRWASGRSSYTQGAKILEKPDAAAREWLAHYGSLGKTYGARAILASGTHGDINPSSGNQARGFADAIIRYNSQGGARPTFVNATLPQFCAAIDEAEARTPFMPAIRGCFGHSWELWPVCLAKYAADMREGERGFLSSEALLAIASQVDLALPARTGETRRKGEWSLAMLSDHAWNGTDDNNKRHNADLRKKWADELLATDAKMAIAALDALKLSDVKDRAILFNALSFPRRALASVPAGSEPRAVFHIGKPITSQRLGNDLVFVSPEVPGFSFAQLDLKSDQQGKKEPDNLKASPRSLDGPFYRLDIDEKTGGIGSLVHKPTGRELTAHANRRTLGQSVFFDGKEHTLSGIRTAVIAHGPVFARLRISGSTRGIDVQTDVTIYAELDRVDLDTRIQKPVTTSEQRLCQFFPILRDGSTMRIETTGAVIRPRPQPQGELLPGADARRFAVQGFVDVTGVDGFGVSIVPLDAFALRLDLDAPAFEAIGNDQNYREVIHDQHGATGFRFCYSIRAHSGGYDNAAVVAYSRNAATPMITAIGILDGRQLPPPIQIDPRRAIATCLKPADDGNGLIVRLWETAGKSGPLEIPVPSFKKAVLTDLLERDLAPLQLSAGKITVNLKPHGFSAVRLLN